VPPRDQLRLFNWMVPLVRAAERLTHPPVGLSLVSVSRKRGQGIGGRAALAVSSNPEFKPCVASKCWEEGESRRSQPGLPGTDPPVGEPRDLASPNQPQCKKGDYR